eukprot:CAMPEP_0174914984 /NCGR_PEP_ID=MMETSP0167-20121228/81127_1 /TAXON_ID=38298 /ORGANISM="Rhodella maculata, Strain CCMP736" /LENGTH=138 /DNA_ID=CAMNT_0016159771 /DNA_START=381 /DNA_END=794 /DNA_ORIENTATION=-
MNESSITNASSATVGFYDAHPYGHIMKEFTSVSSPLNASSSNAPKSMPKSSLKRHVRCIHEGIKQHQCSLCERKFFEADNLRKHTRFVHGDQIERAELHEIAWGKPKEASTLAASKNEPIVEVLKRASLCSESSTSHW